MKNTNRIIKQQLFASPLKILIITSIAVLLINALVMFLTSVIDGIDYSTMIIFHIILPTILLFPILYIFVYRHSISYTNELKKLSLAIEYSPNAIIITNTNGVIEFANKKFTQLSGYSLVETIGKSPRILKSGNNSPKMYQKLWNNITSGKEWQGILQNKKKNGELYYERVKISPIYNNKGKLTHYLGIKEDITKQKLSHEKMKHLAYHDTLTKLPNRLLFNERIKSALRKSDNLEEKNIVLMYLDLDGFKQINDTLGHSAGDQLIKEVAKRLKQTVRKTDTVARVGGDEFIVLLENVADKKNIVNIAKTILKSFEKPWVYKKGNYHITTSIGVAIYNDDGDTIDSLIKKADTAMYKAKEQGKNKFIICNSETKRHA